MHDLYDPREMEPKYQVLVPSLVRLAQQLKRYQYTVGYVHRNSQRFMDVHCYPTDVVDYDDYWSAAEQSITEAETSDVSANDADEESS